MSFPASTGQLSDTWIQACRLGISVKNATNNILSQSQSALPANNAIQYAQFLSGAIAALNQYAAVGGIAAYAQQQANNPSLNIVTEFTNMVTDIQAVVNWITGNFPKDGSSNLLYAKFNGDGSLAYTSFPNSVLTAAFIPLLQTLINQIN